MKPKQAPGFRVSGAVGAEGCQGFGAGRFRRFRESAVCFFVSGSNDMELLILLEFPVRHALCEEIK